MNEKKSNQVALTVTLLLHILVFLIPTPKTNITIQATPEIYSVPIQMTVVQEEKKIPPTPPKKRKEKANRSSTKNTTPPKPITSLPGDQKSATIIHSQTPYYPKEALSLGLKGTIIIEASVNYKGLVSSYKVIQSTGHPILDNAFIRSLQFYTFNPKRIMGKDQSDTLRIKYTFQ